MKLIGGIDFDELRKQRVKNYDTFTVDLSMAATDKKFILTGNYIYLVEATDITVQVDVKFCEQSRKAIKMVHGRGVRTPFYRLYLSYAAQAGKFATFAVGVGQEDVFEIFDVGKALEITGTVPISAAAAIPTSPAVNAALAGSSFIGTTVTSGTTGTHNGTVGLWNPAASGINAYITALEIVSLYNTAMAKFLLFINDISFQTLDTANMWHGNILAGGAASIAKPFQGKVTPTDLATIKVGADFFDRDQMVETLERKSRIVLPTPIGLPPGYGLMAYCGASSVDFLVANMTWTEESV
ncbi:hypothetical protein ES707_11660 [subsurface metagenome]